MAEAEFIEHTRSYRFPSSLTATGGGSLLSLATSGRPVADRLFFAGALRRPELAAQLLLAVSEVALKRFYIPPGMLARILRAADPVVTAAEGRLRFESLSRCCGVYARADLLPEMLLAETCGKGTTNSDFNPPMRAALTRVRDQDGLNLRITPEQIAISSARNAAVEDKVKLPVRWLRGFAEVQALAATLQSVMTLSAPAARRFLAAIPAEVRASDQVWLLPAGNGVRISRQRSKTGAAAAGLGRLKPMVPLARYADRLRIYAGANGVSAFELDFGVARFTLMLSAAAARGFSGEGQLLSRLTRSDRDGALARVRAQLSWQSRLVASEMAVSMGLTETQVTSALSLLATQGLVGFDAHEHCFFHRELPFDRSHIEDLHPRLKDARALLAEGAVTIDGARASVRSGAVTHRVKADSEAFHCTCRWHARTGGESGPCKHVLAAMLAMDENPA